MSSLGAVRHWLNSALKPLNLRVESRTAENLEASRLQGLARAGHFDGPVFPVLRQFLHCDYAAVLEQVRACRSALDAFNRPSADEYSFFNDYYSSPDAEILYAMVRQYQPRRVVEIGSGNSTLLFRRAIADAALATRLISIDPDPRRDIVKHADEVIAQRVEMLDPESTFAELAANDILFIDSSHEIKVGNDVLQLFLSVLPNLAPGVLVHIHDIFLPYEYPKNWVVDLRWNWTENYLLQALLQGSDEFEVLWAGYYFQRTLPDFATHFFNPLGANATSVWLRRTSHGDQGDNR